MKFSGTKAPHRPETKPEQLKRAMEKAKLLTVKYDSMMIQSQKLYDAFENLNYPEVVHKLNLVEEMYNRLLDSNSLMHQANKMAFFFLNFYKDFESNLVYNTKIKSVDDAINIAKKIHKDYNLNSLMFDVGKYELCAENNSAILDCIDPGKDFSTIRERLDILNAELQVHKTQGFETIKDASMISPQDSINMLSMESPINFTGLLSNIAGDKTPMTKSNMNINEITDFSYGDRNSMVDICEQQSPKSRKFLCESNEFLNITNPRKQSTRQSYSTLETKVNNLESNMGNMVKNEAKLKGEISKLKVERDGYKKMLEEQQNFRDLQDAVSSISAALMTNSTISDVKFNNQVLLRNLIDDSLQRKISDYEQKLTESFTQKADLRDKLMDEINRSNITYSYALKYIEVIEKVIQQYNHKDHVSLQETLRDAKVDLKTEYERILTNSDHTAENYEELNRDIDQLDFELSMKQRIFDISSSNQFSDTKRSTSRPRKLQHRKSIENFSKSK